MVVASFCGACAGALLGAVGAVQCRGQQTQQGTQHAPQCCRRARVEAVTYGWVDMTGYVLLLPVFYQQLIVCCQPSVMPAAVAGVVCFGLDTIAALVVLPLGTTFTMRSHFAPAVSVRCAMLSAWPNQHLLPQGANACTQLHTAGCKALVLPRPQACGAEGRGRFCKRYRV